MFCKLLLPNFVVLELFIVFLKKTFVVRHFSGDRNIRKKHQELNCHLATPFNTFQKNISNGVNYFFFNLDRLLKQMLNFGLYPVRSIKKKEKTTPARNHYRDYEREPRLLSCYPFSV